RRRRGAPAADARRDPEGARTAGRGRQGGELRGSRPPARPDPQADRRAGGRLRRRRGMSPARDPLPALAELWLLREGADQDVVVSSRMRLARNVQGFHFKSRFRTEEAERLERHLRGAIKAARPDLAYAS